MPIPVSLCIPACLLHLIYPGSKLFTWHGPNSDPVVAPRRFGSSSDEEKAIQSLDGLDIAGSRIAVEMGPPIPGALEPALAANMLSAGFADQPTSLEEQGVLTLDPLIQFGLP